MSTVVPPKKLFGRRPILTVAERTTMALAARVGTFLRETRGDLAKLRKDFVASTSAMSAYCSAALEDLRQMVFKSGAIEMCGSKACDGLRSTLAPAGVQLLVSQQHQLNGALDEIERSIRTSSHTELLPLLPEQKILLAAAVKYPPDVSAALQDVNRRTRALRTLDYEFEQLMKCHRILSHNRAAEGRRSVGKEVIGAVVELIQQREELLASLRHANGPSICLSNIYQGSPSGRKRDHRDPSKEVSSPPEQSKLTTLCVDSRLFSATPEPSTEQRSAGRSTKLPELVLKPRQRVRSLVSSQPLLSHSDTQSVRNMEKGGPQHYNQLIRDTSNTLKARLENPSGYIRQVVRYLKHDVAVTVGSVGKSLRQEAVDNQRDLVETLQPTGRNTSSTLNTSGAYVVMPGQEDHGANRLLQRKMTHSDDMVHDEIKSQHQLRLLEKVDHSMHATASRHDVGVVVRNTHALQSKAQDV